MRSIPRTERNAPTRWLGGAAAILLAGLLVAWVVAHFPKAPLGPRYIGAGHHTPQSGGTFIFAAGSNIHTLDPHFAYDTLSTAACRLIYDGLLDYDYEGNMIPSLAAELPEISDGGRVFRFKLRDGIKFHNGREITAEDVSWSLHRLLSESVGSPGYPFFKSIVGAQQYHAGEVEQIQGIVVIDEKTIEIQLDEADQTFLNALAMPFAYPIAKEHVEKLEAEEGRDAVGRHPVGAGPFKFSRWERGVQVELERFEDYWAPAARPDRMVFLENISADVASARFRNGDLDILYRPSKVHRLFLRESEAWAPYLAEAPSASLFALGLNCELPPFDNVHIRRAVAFALDRSKLEKLDPGQVIAATQILPPMLAPYDPELPTKQRFDLARAKEEMRLAGFPDGLSEPITLWVRGESEVRVAQLFQQDLKAIGIEIELKMVSFATYLKETGKPRVAQAAFTGWHQDFPDPSNFMDILFHSRSIHPENSENRSFYRNPKLDEILDRARPEIDREKRLALYAEANAILADEAPWAFLYYPVDMFAWQPYVKGFRPHPVWLNEYRNIWLDLPRSRVSQAIYSEEAP
ncbi:MAG TPA: ABC transporter substrate-binding protein [Polyangiales bacterium]|nr:ABC transporter substrate-binding protein [Polyangiales bacterium]